MRAIRNGLQGAGIPVENSKGEASAGQEEINVRYADALTMADRHAIIKNGCKEIAWSKGKAITFLAKWNYNAAGSSSHIHQSLWSARRQDAAVLRREGQVRHVADDAATTSPVFWPMPAKSPISWRPTSTPTSASWPAPSRRPRPIWSKDNRTAGYRLCGEDTKAIRIECRVGGSDLNPYLAFAALLAAGIDGIENKLELEAPFVGDAYGARERSRNSAHAARRDGGDDEIEDAARRLRRRCDRSLHPRCRMGAGRIRPPRHRLGSGAGFREGVR